VLKVENVTNFPNSSHSASPLLMFPLEVCCKTYQEETSVKRPASIDLFWHNTSVQQTDGRIYYS